MSQHLTAGYAVSSHGNTSLSLTQGNDAVSGIQGVPVVIDKAADSVGAVSEGAEGDVKHRIGRHALHGFGNRNDRSRPDCRAAHGGFGMMDTAGIAFPVEEAVPFALRELYIASGLAGGYRCNDEVAKRYSSEISAASG